MNKAAQGFLPEAYFSYVEGGNPQRTLLIGKIAIYVCKLIIIRCKLDLSIERSAHFNRQNSWGV